MEEVLTPDSSDTEEPLLSRAASTGARRESYKFNPNKDHRQAVRAKAEKSSPPLKPLPSPALSRSNSPGPSFSLTRQESSAAESSGSSPASVPERAIASSSSFASLCFHGCLRGLCDLLKGKHTEKKQDKEPPRRWYLVYPITDELYFVRPDAGMAGRVDGHPDAGFLEVVESEFLDEMKFDEEDTSPVKSRLKQNMKRSGRCASVPSNLDRMQGLGDPGFDDSFVNLCKLCYDKSADVVLLPCRHGGMCEGCLRRSLFSRPKHKGGHTCPWCRKKIIEVIKMYEDGAIREYGYAVDAGCFFQGKDDN